VLSNYFVLLVALDPLCPTVPRRDLSARIKLKDCIIYNRLNQAPILGFTL